MSDAHGLTKENLLFALPGGLRENQSLAALGDVTADALAKRPAEIALLALYPRIDELPEDLLDILARDFKVDWWDVNYSLEEKRRTLKDSWRVHKMLGTKAAVETAISAIYPHTRVLEWWEYGGEPYHFRLDINITNDTIDSEKQRRVLERMNYYKSLRSHNDGVTYFVEAKPAVARAVPCAAGLEETARVPLVLPIPIIKPTANVRAGVVTGLWETFTTGVCIPVRSVKSIVQARTTTLTGMEETFITGLVLPEPEPPAAGAKARTGIAVGLVECYTAKAIPLMEKALTATTQARAAGVAAATQETAKTVIDLRR